MPSDPTAVRRRGRTGSQPPPPSISGSGPQARAGRAGALEAWLAGLLPPVDGVALIAVGGLARRECLPHTDLDLLIVHKGRSDMEDVAAAVWYPVWDAGLGLDHAVRTTPEVLMVAADDVRAALGLLDGRCVAGDATLADDLCAAVRAQWRREAPAKLAALRELTEARWRMQGELAFLLEGDVKEARGGLRDVLNLRGIAYAQVATVLRPSVRSAYERMLAVREALHDVAGRRLDRLVADVQGAVARRLDLVDADALARRVADDARTIANAGDDAWRAVERWLSHRGRRGGGRTVPARRPLDDGVVEHSGEIVLSRSAVTEPDPALSLRVASAAAASGLPIAPATLSWLAEAGPPLPEPWPAQVLDAFLGLLGSGRRLVEVWESCDRYGLVDRWLPEWARVRSLPQRNPVHRYTVDRHLVETAADAAAYARDVSRPDLLALAGLLHDIGKGSSGDHSVDGVPVARSICDRIGLPPVDAAVIAMTVRLHLLLPDTATRRDLGDPATIQAVADAVRDVESLDLLHALARADAAATGPLAWSDWKARLVEELVRRVRSVLGGGTPPAPPVPGPELYALVTGAVPAVAVQDGRVVVASAPRPGLLAAVAGCLALHRLEVLTADATMIQGRAVVECVARPRFGASSAPDTGLLVADLRRAVAGTLPVAERLAARDRSPSRRPFAAPAARVVWFPGVATGATVLELRAADAAGLLYRVTRALEDVGADIRAARISTLGADVVDAFYLVGAYDDATERAKVEQAVLAAAG